MTTPAVKTDAKNRALRTFVQGVLIDLLIAIALTAHGILTAEEGFSWTVLGMAVLKTVLTTLTSYVMRIKMGGVLLHEQRVDEPLTVKIGDYELEVQRPGKADHAPKTQEVG